MCGGYYPLPTPYPPGSASLLGDFGEEVGGAVAAAAAGSGSGVVVAWGSGAVLRVGILRVLESVYRGGGGGRGRERLLAGQLRLLLEATAMKEGGGRGGGGTPTPPAPTQS